MQLSNCFVQDISQTLTDGTIFLLYAIFFFILASNISLIYGFYKTSRPFSIPTKLFILLSICDISFGLSGVLLTIFGIFKIESLSCTFYMALFSLNTFLFFYVSCIFTTICTLRYVAFRRPFLHIKERTIWLALFVESLVIGTVMFLMYILHTREETKESVYGPLLNNIFSTALIVTSLAVNLLSYVHLKRLASQTSRNNNASIELDNHRQ